MRCSRRACHVLALLGSKLYLVGALAEAHQKVVGLDVSVDEALGVDVLNAGELHATPHISCGLQMMRCRQ